MRCARNHPGRLLCLTLQEYVCTAVFVADMVLKVGGDI
jgi:hypothetical protein